VVVVAEIKHKPVDWKTQSRRIVLRHEMAKFTKAFRDNFVTLMISSLGLLVALSWNNFWTTWVSSLMIENTVNYKFYIAMGMTVLAVVLTYIFSKLKNNQ
jgi:uncharacterized membrane protein (DUF485 family)